MFWSSSMRRKEAAAIYPAWRGGYYYAASPRLQVGADRRALRFAMVERREGIGVRGGVREVAGAALSGAAGLGMDGKVADDAPPADSCALYAKACLADGRGNCLIEVRGDPC